MKKMLSATAMSLVLANAALAGGKNQVFIEPEVVVEDAVAQASSSSATAVLLLMTLVVFATAAASGGSSNVAGGMGMAASDARLKTGITATGRTTVHGLPLYQFSYKGHENHVFEGVMAQDVIKVMPDAVVTADNGMMAVNYEMLGSAIKVIR